MRPGIALRPDYDAAQLWALAKATRDAGQSRRLLALAEIYDGGSRTRAARIGGVGLQTIRDWVVRFNARGPEGLIDGKAPGNTCKLNDSQRQALAEMVENGPTPAIHGVVRWRLKDLTLWVWEEFQISLSETTLSRELRALGYRKLSARPRHYAQNPEALELFKKPPGHLGSDPGGPPERHPDRAVVAGRGARGPEEQDCPPLGPTRHPAPRPARSADEFGLHLRSDLPATGQGRGLGAAPMRHAGHEPAPGGSRTSRGSRSPWGHADGPGRMAPRQGPRRARQPHAGAAASPSARIEPGREHLAFSARELVVEPRVRLLPRHRRSLLRRVEPPHRPALDHHVHRPPGLGQCMMISAGWVELGCTIVGLSRPEPRRRTDHGCYAPPELWSRGGVFRSGRRETVGTACGTAQAGQSCHCDSVGEVRSDHHDS